MGENIRNAIHKYYDNSYENIGAWNSFSWYVRSLHVNVVLGVTTFEAYPFHVAFD